MTERSLQVPYRKGRAFAAYLHLSHATGEKSAKTVGGGLVMTSLTGWESYPCLIVTMTLAISSPANSPRGSRPSYGTTPMGSRKNRSKPREMC